MNKRLLFSLLYLGSVFMSSVSQVILKKSAMSGHGSKLKEYLNVRVIVAYTIFFGATLVTVLALKYVPLSHGNIFEATGYVYVGILSVLFLKEKLSGRKLLGMAFILAGVIVYAV